MSNPLPPRRFRLCQTVQVDWCGGVYVGAIEAVKPGENLRPPLPGWAYVVRLPRDDSRAAARVIVAEGKLKGLTEE